MRMRGASAHNPQDMVVGIDQQKLPLLVKEAELMVGEIVADQLGAVDTQRVETVANVPRSQTDRQHNCVGIENSPAGRQLEKLRTVLLKGDSKGRETAREGRLTSHVGGWTRRGQHQSATVIDRPILGREILAA